MIRRTPSRIRTRTGIRISKSTFTRWAEVVNGRKSNSPVWHESWKEAHSRRAGATGDSRRSGLGRPRDSEVSRPGRSGQYRA